jgi:F-type H+-transporting ATPase subunit delta
VSSNQTDTIATARRYATAIFALAAEAKKEALVTEEISVLGDAVKSSAELRSALANPLVTREQKAAVLEALAASGHDLTRRALAVVAGGGRADVLPAIAEQLRTMLNARRGELVAEVTSARPLSDAVRKQLSEALAKATGKPVKIEMKEDASVLGGMAVQLGSMRLDATLSGALNQFRAELLTHANQSS